MSQIVTWHENEEEEIKQGGNMKATDYRCQKAHKKTAGGKKVKQETN